MADLPIAIARLIAELSKPEGAGLAPKEALDAVWDALEQLDLAPDTAQQLRDQIAEAKAAGQQQLNGTPLFLLEAMLQGQDDEGGQHDD